MISDYEDNGECVFAELRTGLAELLTFLDEKVRSYTKARFEEIAAAKSQAKAKGGWAFDII